MRIKNRGTLRFVDDIVIRGLFVKTMYKNIGTLVLLVNVMSYAVEQPNDTKKEVESSRLATAKVSAKSIGRRAVDAVKLKYKACKNQFDGVRDFVFTDKVDKGMWLANSLRFTRNMMGIIGACVMIKRLISLAKACLQDEMNDEEADVAIQRRAQRR